MEFYIRSTLKDQISGEVGWQQKSYAVTPGIHIFRVARPSRPCVAGASRPPGKDGQAHCSTGQRPARLKGKMPSPRQEFAQSVHRRPDLRESAMRKDIRNQMPQRPKRLEFRTCSSVINAFGTSTPGAISS
jgi:hypothetical protein